MDKPETRGRKPKHFPECTTAEMREVFKKRYRKNPESQIKRVRNYRKNNPLKYLFFKKKECLFYGVLKRDTNWNELNTEDMRLRRRLKHATNDDEIKEIKERLKKISTEKSKLREELLTQEKRREIDILARKEFGLENIENNTLNSNLNSNSTNNTTISINNNNISITKSDDDSNLSSISSTMHITSASEQDDNAVLAENNNLEDVNIVLNDQQLDNQQLDNQQTPNQPNPQCRFIHANSLPPKKRPINFIDAEEGVQKSQTQTIWQPWN